MKRRQKRPHPGRCTVLSILAATSALCAARAQAAAIATVRADGSYRIQMEGADAPVLTAGVAARIDGRWVRLSDYPRHAITHAPGVGVLGAAEVWQVTCTGLANTPDLVYRLRSYRQQPMADVQVTVRNTTGVPVHVDDLRVLESVASPSSPVAALGGAATADRVLSDSFSEDRPAMRIHDLGDAKAGMFRAVGSQLLYNRDSHASLFVGALSADRFLTVIRLHLDAAGADPHISRYEVDSEGTTELEEENSLEHAPAQDRVQLSLPVAPGGQLASETVMISGSHDYHAQLEQYGALIRQLHHARVEAPPLMGWWSWTAYYFGLNSGTALTNAQWLAEHLESYGYNVFHIDEGYQYARGEYTTPDTSNFPAGLTPVEYQVRGLGLLPGIWTAPFEVSVRSWVYLHHPDWLVHNAAGRPIHAGFVVDSKDPLYILDTTNPGAQAYLRATYTEMVRDWGIHYIKLDFMDDSAIEGFYYRPNTTAMEAQRIGLGIIRSAVGPDVFLDKDGSVMLNPVGYVDYGRISQDTGLSFGASRDAATGIAARYYMNRNFFVSDPDAFTVSTQHIQDQTWHSGKKPLTLDEAQVSIALAAVSGGMLEIGDNLPSLQNSPERVALLENPNLIDMVRLGRASIPLDLMSYAPADRQPSVFFLKESSRQSVLTVFNWTDHATHHVLHLQDDLGLAAGHRYAAADALDASRPVSLDKGAVSVELPAHSVRVIRLLDETAPDVFPAFSIHCPPSARTGQFVAVSAAATGGSPVVSWSWEFGDGVHVAGQHAAHAWTEPGDYTVRATAEGLDGKRTEKTIIVQVAGRISTVFDPGAMRHP